MRPFDRSSRTSALVAILLATSACRAPLPSAAARASYPAPADGPLAAEAKGSSSPDRAPANVMGMEGAAWLERPGRDQEELPEVVLAAMDLRLGLTVAEIGAGTGYFSRRIAKEVGPQGRVYAVDIQAPMLELLKEYAAKAGVANVVTVLGGEADPKLPPHSIDRMLLVDVYHEFQQPREMLERLAATLAPGGRVILVEYRAEGSSAKHILVAHRMSVAQVLSEWTPAGFELERRVETLPSQHLFVFRYRGAPEAK